MKSTPPGKIYYPIMFNRALCCQRERIRRKFATSLQKCDLDLHVSNVGNRRALSTAEPKNQVVENEAVSRMLAESHASVYQIDIFKKLLVTRHDDNLHLNTEFLTLFFELMKASEEEQE